MCVLSFYEGIRRRPAGNYEQEQAPWGLNCSRADMMELEFYLDQAKAAEDGRLSVSRETKSEIAGQRNLAREEIREMVVWDYRELLPMLEGQERRSRKAEGREPLVLAGAVRCGEGRFDSVKQRFAMDIYDRYGRRISVAVNYSKEEKLTIQALERLSARLAGQQGKEQKEKGWQEKARTLVFFGIPYLEGGSLCLYPIEYFEGKKVWSGSGDFRSGRNAACAGKRKPAGRRNSQSPGAASSGDASDAGRSVSERS